MTPETGGLDDEGAGMQDVAAAIALICRRKAAVRDISRSAVIGDSRPGHVIGALEAITDALLDLVAPADGGELLLQRIGLHVAERVSLEMTTEPPAASAAPRCGWHDDRRDARCADPQASPGAKDTPPFCARHLSALEPWIASRAAQQASSAPAWIEWAARRAADVQALRQMLGDRPDGTMPRRRTPRTPRGRA